MAEKKKSLEDLWGIGAKTFAAFGGGEAYLRQERAAWDAADICLANPFKPHAQSAERRRSAVGLVKLLLANRSHEFSSAHVCELLTILLWKITEAESRHKYRTRFQSLCAVVYRDSMQLRHEHVYQRSQMIEELLHASPIEVDGILSKAVGCTVTVDEHKRLERFDADYGWERYRKANIEVIDTLTAEHVSFDNPPCHGRTATG